MNHSRNIFFLFLLTIITSIMKGYLSLLFGEAYFNNNYFIWDAGTDVLVYATVFYLSWSVRIKAVYFYWLYLCAWVIFPFVVLNFIKELMGINEYSHTDLIFITIGFINAYRLWKKKEK